MAINYLVDHTLIRIKILATGTEDRSSIMVEKEEQRLPPYFAF